MLLHARCTKKYEVRHGPSRAPTEQFYLLYARWLLHFFFLLLFGSSSFFWLPPLCAPFFFIYSSSPSSSSSTYLYYLQSIRCIFPWRSFGIQLNGLGRDQKIWPHWNFRSKKMRSLRTWGSRHTNAHGRRKCFECYNNNACLCLTPTGSSRLHIDSILENEKMEEICNQFIRVSLVFIFIFRFGSSSYSISRH